MGDLEKVNKPNAGVRAFIGMGLSIDSLKLEPDSILVDFRYSR